MVDTEIRSVYSSGGSTFVSFNKSGSKLLVAGTSGIIRVYKSGVGNDEEEPETFDILEEATDLVVLDDDRFAVSSLNGEVDLYSIAKRGKIKTALRSPLPVRSIVFTHNGAMIAGAGDDDEVQIASVEEDDTRDTIKFRPGDQVHDISYNSTTDLISLSLSNGDIKFYSLTLEEPKLVTTISDEISKLIYQDDDDLAEDNVLTAKIEWHLNNDDFAIPTQMQNIKVFSRSNDFKLSYSFAKIHDSNITAMKWSPNGDYLASSDLSNRLLIWDSQTRECLINQKFSNKINNLSWRANDANGYDLTCGSENGNIIILKNVVRQTNANLKSNHHHHSNTSALDEALNQPLDSDTDEGEGEADDINLDSDISNDDGLDGPDGDIQQLRDFVDDDGFLDDDDNAGYTIIPTKRPLDADAEQYIPNYKKKPVALVPSFNKFKLKPYNPGCTPYISDRRYLTMNSVGYISSVKQDTFSSITASFFDQSVHREYHFDDIYGYDLAGLTKIGIVLGVSGEAKNRQGGHIFFRPHDDGGNSWEKQIPLRDGEIITSLTLSDSVFIVGTSCGFIRSFNLFGTPIGIEKSSPVFTIIANMNYIFLVTLANNNQLLYSLKDIDGGRYLQKDLALPLDLPAKGEDLLTGIFFNSHGDPVIIGNDGVVLLLTRWRNPLQSTWVPILDSESKIKEIGGKGELNIWPLGLHKDKLNCILVRGVKNYPNYPLPLPTELDIKLPITNGEDLTEFDVAEEELVRFKTMGELLGECLSTDGEIFEDDQDSLNEYAISYDKSLLKLFSQACVEEKMSKAWKLVQDLKQDKALAAAAKIAERVGLIALLNRVNKLREQRMESEFE